MPYVDYLALDPLNFLLKNATSNTALIQPMKQKHHNQPGVFSQVLLIMVCTVFQIHNSDVYALHISLGFNFHKILTEETFKRKIIAEDCIGDSGSSIHQIKHIFMLSG